MAGVKAEFDVEITEVVENEKIALRSTGGNMKGSWVTTLSPTKTGTKMTEVVEYELPYSVLGKLLDKLRFRQILDNSFKVGFKKLKDMMEK